jgi:hypothetical protein
MTAFRSLSPSTTLTSIAPLTPGGNVTQAGYLNPVKEHMHTYDGIQQFNFYPYELPPAVPDAATQLFPHLSTPQQVYPTTGTIQDGNPRSYPSVGMYPISHPSALAHFQSPYHPELTQTFNMDFFDPGYMNFVNPVAGNYAYNMTTAVEPEILCPQPVYGYNSAAIDNLDTLAEQDHS